MEIGLEACLTHSVCYTVFSNLSARFAGFTSRDFGHTVVRHVRILEPEIPVARSNAFNVLPKRTKKKTVISVLKLSHTSDQTIRSVT